MRQLFFVGLALGGLGIGYGAGFLMKKEEPINIPAQAPVVAATPAPAAIVKPLARQSETPLFPEDSNPATGAPPRAYEEALPREIIIHTRPPEEKQAKEQPPENKETVGSASEKPEVKDKTPAAEPVKEKEVAAVTPLPVDPKPLPRIVLVIDDLGVDKSRTARTIRLPGPLTVSYLTYAQGLSAQTQAART